ncbi:MAG TPA: hypothetical protein VIO57_00095, partial [Chloroflexota bacterium]
AMRRLILAIVSSAILMVAMAGAAVAGPGPSAVGACNMLRDATMSSIPMAHDAAQGNAGMFHAVAVSGC